MSDSVISWTVAHQAPLYMGFPREEFWSGLPCPLTGVIPGPGVEPLSLISTCNGGDPDSILGWEYPLEKGMATHSSILDWRIPWTEEPGGLQLMGSQELDMT